jgi:hypothetical protein
MAKRQTEEFWIECLKRWRHSGLTQIKYCAGQGLGIKSFQRWLRKEREAEQSAKAPLTLVPVSLGATPTSGTVHIRSPGGWQIELPDTDVRQLLDLLRQLS